ncbi:UDP-N-acetylmuramate dehydrogenase [bacterium]|nr:UDP-N-acetylmuramate dehydrogenase [bacterium]
MAHHTTFRAGGRARFFAVAESEDDLRDIISYARKKNIPFFVLGGGSNVLFGDRGFPGLVIKMNIRGIAYGKEKGGITAVSAGAGEHWDNFVGGTVARGFYGLENLSFIPGSVGAAPVQNIGAYGAEAGDVIVEVSTLNTETLEIEIFSKEACMFSYRDSFFKSPAGGKYIITRVVFGLSSKGSVNISYRDVKDYFEERRNDSPALSDVRDAVIAIRTRKLPDVREVGTAGSFFKNPVVSVYDIEKLKEKHPDVKFFPHGDAVKISAGWLLDHVGGFRGYREGNVGAYKNQALVIVNESGASASEILAFAERMQKIIYEKTGITLEPEVKIVE